MRMTRWQVACERISDMIPTIQEMPMPDPDKRTEGGVMRVVW